MQWHHLLARIADQTDPVRPSHPSKATSAALRATLEGRPAIELVPAAELACRDLGGGAWRALACFALGGLRFLRGDDQPAIDAFLEGAFESELIGSPLLQANCLAASAIVSDVCGDHDRAIEVGLRARRLIREHNAELVPTTALVTAMQALIHARRGQRADALDELAISQGNLRGLETVAPWFNVLALFALVRTALLVDDRATTRVLLAALEHQLRFESSGATERRLTELREKAGATRIAGSASWPLTSAELPRVALPADESQPLGHRGASLRVEEHGEVARRVRVPEARRHVAADGRSRRRALPGCSTSPTGRLPSRAGQRTGPPGPSAPMSMRTCSSTARLS